MGRSLGRHFAVALNPLHFLCCLSHHSGSLGSNAVHFIGRSCHHSRCCFLRSGRPLVRFFDRLGMQCRAYALHMDLL